MTQLQLPPQPGPPLAEQVRLRRVDHPDFGLELRPSGTAPPVSGSVRAGDYLLHFPLTGAAGAGPIRCRDRARVTNPGDHVLSALGAHRDDVLEVRLGRALVDEEYAALSGEAPDGLVRFDPVLDLRAQPTAGIAVVLEGLAAQQCSAHELFASAALQLRQARTLAAACLLSAPHSLTSALVLGQSPLRPRTLRRAMRYADEHFADPLSLSDLAGAAGCSPRTVNSAFREHLGVTPMTYVRDLRLERVRDELVAGTAPVSTVAYRCGFTHLGRFAAVYERRFGELPSQTARRG